MRSSAPSSTGTKARWNATDDAAGSNAVDVGASRNAVVVGGSLAGLCAALALSRDGWSVTILEQSVNEPTGMGISIDKELLASVTGADTSGLPVIETGFPATGWALIRSLLAAEISRRPNVVTRRGVRVTGVRPDAGLRKARVTINRADLHADLVVGADGHASTVRRFVAPEEPHARYGGYVLWRGLVDEREVPGGFRMNDLQFAISHRGGGMLGTYGIPGADGELRPGRRRGAFIWFDNSRAHLFRDAGKLDGDVVGGTLKGVEVIDAVLGELEQEARLWDPPWRAAISDNLRRRDFIGAPVAEYMPVRTARGRVAIVGDAAHSVGPVTGAGFHNGLLDVQALSQVLKDATPDGVAHALHRYDKNRLQPARELVRRSRDWSRSFGSPR